MCRTEAELFTDRASLGGFQSDCISPHGKSCSNGGSKFLDMVIPYTTKHKVSENEIF